MTEQETIRIVTLIVMSYPSHDKLKDEATVKGMISVWKTIFCDDDVRLVEIAVQKHIAINKWPPSIAEVREQMLSLTRPDIIPPDVAWAAVKDLLYVYSEYSSPNLYKELPESVARVVETIEWSKLYNLHCGHYRGNPDGMDRVAFMDLYKPAYERDRENAMLPQKLQNIVSKKQIEVGGEIINKLTGAREKRKVAEKKYALLNGR